jgi:signal transduction histidine kinase
MRINVRFDIAECVANKGDDGDLIKIKSHHEPSLLERWKRRQHGLLQSLLLYHGREDHATVRVLLLACIGTVGMPLYYVIWQHFFPQEYESLPLRMLGILLCAIGLFARQFSRQMLNLYLLVALSYIFPFFFTFMFLMNHGSGVWGESLLIGLVVLFHFDTGLALRAYAIGTVLACAGAVALGAGDALSSREVLQQLPIHWFTIAVLSAAKISRQVLAQEKLAGMGAGLATVAHELRTPLTSVDANVRGLLRRGRPDAGPGRPPHHHRRAGAHPVRGAPYEPHDRPVPAQRHGGAAKPASGGDGVDGSGDRGGAAALPVLQPEAAEDGAAGTAPRLPVRRPERAGGGGAA